MTGQVWNLHTPLVAHAIGVMSHWYCCGRLGGMLVIYNLDDGKCDNNVCCVRLFLSLEYWLKIKLKKKLLLPKYQSEII